MTGKITADVVTTRQQTDNNEHDEADNTETTSTKAATAASRRASPILYVTT